jgi:hypothetical protein
MQLTFIYWEYKSWCRCNCTTAALQKVRNYWPYFAKRVGAAQSLHRLGYGLDDQGSILGSGSYKAPRPNRRCGPPNIYQVGTGSSFTGGQSGRDVKLTIHLTLMSRLRMREAIPALLQHVFMAWCLIKQWICLLCLVHSKAHRKHYFYLLPLYTILKNTWNKSCKSQRDLYIVPCSNDFWNKSLLSNLIIFKVI